MQIGKWEWIARVCEQHKAWLPAWYAWRIEEALQELYGTTVTEQWAMLPHVETETISDFVVRVIASVASYCIACVRNGHNCLKCEFGYRCGVCCVDYQSLYQKFKRAIFESEWEEMIDAEV